MRRVTREKFVLGGAAVIGGLAVGQTGRATGLFGHTRSTVPLVARIRSIRPPSMLTAIEGDSDVAVVIAPNAHVFRDTVARLVDFVPGERIVAEGEKGADGVFVATSLVPLFIVREADVMSVSGSTVETPFGRVRVSEHALYWNGGSWTQLPVQPITAGRRLQFVARKDLSTGDFVGVRFNSLLAA